MVDHVPYLNFGRQWGYALSMGVLVVIAGPVVLPHCCPSISPLRWSIQAAIVTSYILYLLHRNLRLNTHPDDLRPLSSLGAANWITLARGGLIAFLAGFLLQSWPGRSHGYEWIKWLPGSIYIIASFCDVLDGFVAKITANRTLLGELLDTKIDALGILVASLLAITYGQLPEFYIGAGLAYYIVQFAVWLRKKKGKPCAEVRRRQGAKLLAGAQMAFLGVVLLPLLSPPVTKVAALFFLIPFLAGFLLDWQIVCRHEKCTQIS